MAVGQPAMRLVVSRFSSGQPAARLVVARVALSGQPSARLRLVRVIPLGQPAARLVVARAALLGQPAARLRVARYGLGQPAARLAVSRYDPADPIYWRVAVRLGGLDISTQLVGEISVEAEEGAARTASLSLRPPAGVIAPLDYVGLRLEIDHIGIWGGSASVARRLFTGKVDTPSFRPAESLLALACTDDLQNLVAAQSKPAIDALTGGRYSLAVQGEIDDGWAYAQALMSTVSASLDASAHGALRVTLWQTGAPDKTFDASRLLYGESSVQYPQRSTLVNEVRAVFEYRFPRLRVRYGSIGFSATRAEMAASGFQYPTASEVLGAAGGSGWTVTQAVFYPAPAAIPYGPDGGFVYPDPNGIDMAAMSLVQRHHQTITETYALTLKSTASVSLSGTLAADLRGALESRFDGGAWESAVDRYPIIPFGGEMDYAPDAPRSAANMAIQTLLDQGRTKILASHRSARVGNAVPCDPSLDLTQRVRIEHAGLVAEGKIARLVHRLDLGSGRAVTEFQIACFGLGGTGLDTPDDLEPPEPPPASEGSKSWLAQVANLTVAVHGTNVYSESICGLLANPPETITVEDAPSIGSVTYNNPAYVAGGFPETGFRVRMPGVDDADRDPITRSVEREYSVVVPLDPLQFTIT